MPSRDGIGPARLGMPADGRWETVLDFVVARTGVLADELAKAISRGEVMLGDGSAVSEHTAYQRGEVVYLYRPLRPEVEVPFVLTVLHQDNDIIVVDKPHFLATMPRGRHVVQTVVTRVRRDLGLRDAAPAHRLDRLTAGVLMLTLRPEVRAAYQNLFACGEVAKTYAALAPHNASLSNPVTVHNRLVKERGRWQTEVVDGEPNARTTVRLREVRGDLSIYELHPHTGKTHQLRVHCAGLGVPIVGDPLYPEVRDVAADDFSDPLRLVAERLEFTDPLNGVQRVFESVRAVDSG